VWFCHGIFLTQVRDFNKGILLGFGIVYVQWLIIFIITNGRIQSDPLYRSIWEAMGDIQFWAVFFVTYALMIIPVILYRITQSLIVSNKFNYA
jgi:hypothetical protein